MSTKRKSGILLHPTSLPSLYGIGDLGQAAYDFIDRLEAACQSLWQVLPLCPTDHGGSPYQSCSAFAGNPLLISPEALAEEGLLTKTDISVTLPAVSRVNYKKAAEIKGPLFEKAFQNFKKTTPPADYSAFQQENAFWLEDYALFLALKAYFQAERQKENEADGFLPFLAECEAAGAALSAEEPEGYYFAAAWNTFPAPLRKRNGASLKKWGRLLSEPIEKEIFLQYIFHRQWRRLKAYANEKGISIIGDAPIFVAFDSADVWANQSLFQLDNKGLGFPRSVAGVPPDYFSETGQLWGNPLYNWKQHEKTDFFWWVNRIRKNLEDVDMLRIDHFRGFAAHWEIPFGAEDARGGSWVQGPGLKFFRALGERLGHLPLIAEDLGIITEEVNALRETAGLPGMRVLQFAFGGDKNNAYLPHRFNKNTVVYTGTHDNDTCRGWYESATEKEKDHYRRYMNVSGNDAAWDFIRLAFSSPADLAIIPLQDVFNLGSEHRMNTPGTTEGNWSFAFTFDQWREGHTQGLRYLSELFGRNEAQLEKIEKQENNVPFY